MSQLSLFAPEPGELNVPVVIRRALDGGASLAVSISGGKDGQAMLSAVVPWFWKHGYEGQLFAIHSDLGRAEWPQTSAFIEHLAQQAGVPLVVVRRAKGDLVARIEERLVKVRQDAEDRKPVPFWPSSASRYCTAPADRAHLKTGPINQALRNPIPFWPSSGQRYCTSDLKRGPIDTKLRSFERSPAGVIISAEGVRSGESRERAKKPVVEIREAITAGSKFVESNLASMTPDDALTLRGPGQRVAFNWRPIFNWTLEQVWLGCGTSVAELKRRRALYKLGEHERALSGWSAHPAYVFGNERLSCSICVLASKNDLLNGANHNPDTYLRYLELELEGDATFKNGWSLLDLPVTGRAKEVRDNFLMKGSQTKGRKNEKD